MRLHLAHKDCECAQSSEERKPIRRWAGRLPRSSVDDLALPSRHRHLAEGLVDLDLAGEALRVVLITMLGVVCRPGDPGTSFGSPP